MTRRLAEAPSDLAPANGPPSAPRTELSAPARDPISPFAHEVLALFRGPLAEVRFPDVDRDALDALATASLDAQREVEGLEAALESARAQAADAQVALTDRAGRALAYARVFAAGQPTLEDALAAVRTPAPRPAPRSSGARDAGVREVASPRDELGRGDLVESPPRRRGRPRRELEKSALLPMSDPEPMNHPEPVLAAAPILAQALSAHLDEVSAE